MSSRGINKVILIGNLGNDPEAKSMPGGNAVTNITLATSESWKDKQTGQQQERTEWHRVVFFNQLAEIAAKYLTKGSKVYIEGSPRTRKWEKDGATMYTTEIIADQMQMLDSRPQSEQSTRQNSNGTQPSYSAPLAQQQQYPDDFDDDIPF